MVEPEVVATSPNRIKSPVPVCCGFGSVRMVLATGVAPALATFSTSCLCYWTTRAKWILQPVLPRQDCFTKETRRLLHGGKTDCHSWLEERRMVAVSGAAPDTAGL